VLEAIEAPSVGIYDSCLARSTLISPHQQVAAELIFELANAPQRIGPRLTRTQVEATFPKTHLDEQMKGFGMWEDWQKGTRGRKP